MLQAIRWSNPCSVCRCSLEFSDVAKSKLGQLLGEVLVHHAPWTSEIAENTKRRITDEWLDGLEAHTASFTGPLMQMVLDNSNPPDAIKALLQEVIEPTAAFSAILEQIFLFGIASTVIGTSIQPFLQEVSNELNTAAVAAGVARPLSPADIATMVVRGVAPGNAPITPLPGWAASTAAENGIDEQDMQAIVDSVGNPPAPQDLFEMIRRGIIDETQLEQGIREGDTRDEWIQYLTQLRYTTPTPIDLVRAAVQNQMDYATADSLAAQLGLEPAGYINDNPDWFQLLFNIAGRPPGPEEVGRMANRGIVPFDGTGASATTFAQAIAESDIKTKWTTALQAIQQWWPNNGEVRELLVNGAITAEVAQQYWAGNGVPAGLLPALLHQAQVQEITTEKALAKGNILTLLYDGAISEDVALQLLGQIGISGATAQYTIEITGLRREIRALDMAIRKIGNLYVNYKLTATDATTALNTLGVPPDQITGMLTIWATEREQPVRLPTVEQLGKAVEYGVIDGATAISKAQLLGYTAYDAWLVLSAIAEAPIGTAPPDTDTGVDV